MTQLHDVTFCVLDLETTGTDPGWDDITEVGAILVRGGERLGTFHTLVGPAAGGGLPGVDAVLASLLGFVGDAVITGHNIGFDLRFLDAALARTDRGAFPRRHVVDTMFLARALLRDDTDDCRLGTLAARFAFDHQPCHRAFDDAAATVELLHLLIERAWSFGATTLDDLCDLPALAGHRFAAKLRHTATLPRAPGVYVARDRDGQPVWVGEADDIRRDVRSLWTRHGGSVHASVLRDTASWEVYLLDSPWCRRVAVERLLHEHRPRAQRRRITGDQAAFVCLEPSKHGWRATARRVPSTRRDAVHLGPVTARADATAAVTALRRLAARGVELADVRRMFGLHGPADGDGDGSGDGCGDGDQAGTPTTPWLVLGDELDADDPVVSALARRDLAALDHLVDAHLRVARARRLDGWLIDAGERLAVRGGLLHHPGLPLPRTAPTADEPWPVTWLSEAMLMADAMLGPSPSSSPAVGVASGDVRPAPGTSPVPS
ncbi:MAG: hypothetical protein KDB40_20200 [Acidimicrobiales bacterium]|nr:hypothetical protein [Acidimicrobiales bacterium]MCB9395935.1 hypothetical protein [Acidimicrobiaceae bacterium]